MDVMVVKWVACGKCVEGEVENIGKVHQRVCYKKFLSLLRSVVCCRAELSAVLVSITRYKY